MKDNFNFKILKKDKSTKARAGEIHTAHGVVETPCFVAVGTQATVKTLSPDDLKTIGVELLFGNTYHLHLRPGEETVKDFGGLAEFMSWNGPTITDSGGFQVFSLGKLKVGNSAEVANKIFLQRNSLRLKQPSCKNFISSPRQREKDTSDGGSPELDSEHDSSEVDQDIPKLVKINEDGVKLRSHIDGSLHVFTPELSIEIQKKLGADIILCFDECAPHPSTHEYTKKAMERTHEWAKRCLAEFKASLNLEDRKRKTEDRLQKDGNGRNLQSQSSVSSVSSAIRPLSSVISPPNSYYSYQQALYGIIQGGIYKDLRIDSAKFISNLDFDGIAIGGVSVGESKKEMRDVLDWVTPFLPDEKPRHLLGIGEVDDIFDAVFYGMDTFDCVIPTRFGRYGIVFASPPIGNVKNRFRYDLTKTINAKSQYPVVDNCSCYVCKNYTRGYLHHLFKANELLAYRLASYHNMHFLVNLTKNIRQAILEDRFEEIRKEWLE